MKAFRRSVKGEKTDTAPRHISITPKSDIAIKPPLKVIKALYDHEPDPKNVQQLKFAKGDFFHVVGRENDPNWYEACNPLIPSARGLVPASFFEIIHKNERQSAGSMTSVGGPHDSGYSERGGHSRHDSNATATTARQPRMSSLGKSSGAMVYGCVQYDFNAERPDELEAKQGEYIIVIAQSNPEWFVAKPIGRLGGPGLIPVSFIEIRDITTGEAVADPQEAVQRAGVPKVEEWKRMAADYKNSSITLGKFEAQQAASAQRDLERMSLDNGSQRSANNLHGTSHLQTLQSLAYAQKSPGRPPQSSASDLSRQSSQTSATPVSASVPRYCFDNDKYWYIMECVLEDGRHWELSRYYQDFYDFQIALLQQFPREAGVEVEGQKRDRILPYMPGPVTYVTENISNGRRESLDLYIKELLRLPAYISKSQLVRQLFHPRDGDFEMDPNAVAEDFRLSSASQQSYTAVNDLSRQSSSGQMNGTNGGYPPGMKPQQTRSALQRVPSSSITPHINGTHHYRSPSDFPHNHGPINRQASSLTQHSNTSQPSSGPSTSTTNINHSNAASTSSSILKIKVFFEDDLYAIKVHSEISYAQLKERLRERLKIGQEDIVVQYKDESSGSYAGLAGDSDLDVALERNPKLTLFVQFP